MTETMTQFKTEGSPAFPVENKENDNSSASSTGEQTNDTQTQSPDGEQNTGEKKDGIVKKEDNFAEHPRWKERESDWSKRFNEQEKRHLEEITKIREIVEGKKSQNFEASEEVPPWFGGDVDAWKSYQKHQEEIIKRAEENAIKRFQSMNSEEQKKIDEATQYFNEQVNEIESNKELNPQSLKVDRNKLLKIALDNELVDTKGRWNYKAAFRMMSAKEVFQAKEALNEKKQLANATTSENKPETKKGEYMTSDDFRKPGARPW